MALPFPIHAFELMKCNKSGGKVVPQTLALMNNSAIYLRQGSTSLFTYKQTFLVCFSVTHYNEPIN